MKTFVYKFEMAKDDYLSISSRLDAVINLLYGIDGICDDCMNIAKAADDALFDLESSIRGYKFKYEEPEEVIEMSEWKELERRLLSIENQLGREFYDYKNKVALDIASIDIRIHDHEDRLTAVENQLEEEIVPLLRDHEDRDLIDDRIDILGERIKNLVLKFTDAENKNYSNYNRIIALEERVETMSHKMDALIGRDECFFNKVKKLNNNIKELAQNEADKHNRLAMTVQNLKDFVDGKYDKDNLDISSASFNVYFEKGKNKKEDSDIDGKVAKEGTL